MAMKGKNLVLRMFELSIATSLKWAGNCIASNLPESGVEDEEKDDRRSTEPDPDGMLSALPLLQPFMGYPYCNVKVQDTATIKH